MELCQNVDNAVVLARRGEIRSPENSLLCVFGQANPAPTADDGIGRSFGTLPFMYLSLYSLISITRFNSSNCF